jgi:hypothetical protein
MAIRAGRIMEASKLIRHHRNIAARFVPRGRQTRGTCSAALPDLQPGHKGGYGKSQMLTQSGDARAHAGISACGAVAIALCLNAEVTNVLRLATERLKRGWASRFR